MDEVLYKILYEELDEGKELKKHQKRHLKRVRDLHHEALGKSIYIDEIILYNRSNQKVKLACRKCDKSSFIWTPQIYTGNWSVCEHDLD